MKIKQIALLLMVCGVFIGACGGQTSARREVERIDIALEKIDEEGNIDLELGRLVIYSDEQTVLLDQSGNIIDPSTANYYMGSIFNWKGALKTASGVTADSIAGGGLPAGTFLVGAQLLAQRELPLIYKELREETQFSPESKTIEWYGECQGLERSLRASILVTGIKNAAGDRIKIRFDPTSDAIPGDTLHIIMYRGTNRVEILKLKTSRITPVEIPYISESSIIDNPQVAMFSTENEQIACVYSNALAIRRMEDRIPLQSGVPEETLEPQVQGCGNSIIDPGEQCDGNNWDFVIGCEDFRGTSGGTLKCDSNCMFDLSDCIMKENPLCGNSIIDSGEQCDGENWGVARGCIDFDNFTGGTLFCNSQCVFDTSQCTK